MKTRSSKRPPLRATPKKSRDASARAKPTENVPVVVNGRKTRSTTRKRQTFDFLALPGEIRNMIYRLLVIPSNAGKSLYLHFCNCREDHVLGRFKSLDLTVLRVNHEIHREASSLLYKEAQLTCDILRWKDDGGVAQSKVCKKCNVERGKCLSTLPLPIVASFSTITIRVDFERGFPNRKEWLSLEALCKRLATELRQQHERSATPCELDIEWGEGADIAVPIDDEYHHDLQKVYHFRRLATLLEPLDWLFMDIENVEYSSMRWFDINGQDMCEAGGESRDTFIPLIWGD